MNRHTWVEEVLRDILEYAGENDLPELADDLRNVYVKHAKELVRRVDADTTPRSEVHSPVLERSELTSLSSDAYPSVNSW